MGLKKFWEYMTTDPSKKKKEEKKVNSKSSTTARKLGYAVLLFVLINSMLGSSLFYLPNLGVISSGSASIIAWALIFIIAVLIMFYISELVTLHPSSGGTYEFCKRAYGRFGSFSAGWLIWIAGNFGMALNIVAAAQYFIPPNVANAFILQLIFAAIWIVVLNYLAFRGIDAGVTMLVVFGIIAIVLVTLMTLPAFIDFPSLFAGKFAFSFNPDLMFPFFRHEGVSTLAFLGLSLLLISEAFFGFEIITYMANEVRDIKKLPQILITGTIISGVIMGIYVFSSLGTVPYADYVTNLRPFAVQALNTMGEFGQQIVVFGMYLVIIGAAAAWPITGSRLIRAMAEDKLFVKNLATLHKRYKSPHKAIYFQALAVAIFSAFIFFGAKSGWRDSYRSIYLIYVVLSLIVISMILLTVPILRKKEKNLKRIFKAPLPHAGPIALVIFFTLLIFNWIRLDSVAPTILKLAGSFIIVGLPFYFLVEMFYDPKAIIRVNEYLSYVVVVLEKLFFPLTIRNKIFKTLGNVKGKIILEYGCSVGTLTKKMAPKVTEKGRIYATDLSLNKVKIANRRTKRIKHVSIHHHPHLNDFKLKLPRKVNKVISVGMLSYMQNPKKVLKSLAKRVNKGAEVAFLDYDKFFHLIPNVSWIENDKKLVEMFKEAGFNVKVERKNSLLWQYIIISGKRK
jgi:basic amino acid/polyamine antiporter, APA family